MKVKRLVMPDLQRPIMQRGNDRQDAFFVVGDRVAYLGLLREQCEKYGAPVLGYCLMPNHIHLVAVPAREDSVHLAVRRMHFIYTQYINRLHGRTGRLWQGRFHSRPPLFAALRLRTQDIRSPVIYSSASSNACWVAGCAPYPSAGL